MPNLLPKIRQKGFDVQIDAYRLKIVNAAKLNETQREFIKTHKAELIVELQAEEAAEAAALVPPHVEPVMLVQCGECQHFIRDTFGDGYGIGTCAVGAGHERAEPSRRYPAGYPIDAALYPNILRPCPLFVSKPTSECGKIGHLQSKDHDE